MATVVSIDGSNPEADSYRYDRELHAHALAAARKALAAAAEAREAERHAAAALRQLADWTDLGVTRWGPYVDHVRAAVEEAQHLARELENGCTACGRDGMVEWAAAIAELAEVPIHGLDQYGGPRGPRHDMESRGLSRRAQRMLEDAREQEDRWPTEDPDDAC